MEGTGRDDDLQSFLEFSNLASDSQVNLNFPDDVLAIAQGGPLQNDVSLENRNLIQNPNPSLLNPNPNPNQNHNQEQEQALFSPFENMHLNPNLNDFTEPWFQPHYQPNRALFIRPNHLPSYQNQYMARPSYQPSTNVASTSRGETGILNSSRRRGDALLSIQSQPYGVTMNRPSYSGIGNSASEPMRHNSEGFVRNTRMRVDPGQGSPSVVADSTNTAWYNMGFPRPNPNPGQVTTNHALASNTLSISLARPNSNPGQPLANHALASNPLPIPLSGGGFVPRVGTNMSPMQIMLVTATARAPAPAARVTSESSYTANEAIPAALPSSHHQRVQIMVLVERTTSRQQSIRTIASSGVSQIRSQGVSVHEAVPTTPSAPASSVFVPNHAASASQIGPGALVVPVRPSYILPPIRNRLPGGTSRIVQLEVRMPNLRNFRQARYVLRALYPDADERQLDMLFGRAREMFHEWRQMDRHFDLRLDTDHMSHEELLALQERIGNVKTGVSEELVNGHMIQRPFSALLENGSETCCICLEEYAEDDQVGTLDCGHNFHTECIKKWLACNNTCPICKKPGIGNLESDAPKKI